MLWAKPSSGRGRADEQALGGGPARCSPRPYRSNLATWGGGGLACGERGKLTSAPPKRGTVATAASSAERSSAVVVAPAYPEATELLITADAGGSNSYRSRLWKVELQAFANRTGLTVHVCHFPPGTSKWNKIEHRLFSHISQNWRGRPLVSHEVIVDLIGATTTNTGLKVRAALDPNHYQNGIKVRDAEMRKLAIEKDEFHGEWNYWLIPR
jgi:hypothetical protein